MVASALGVSEPGASGEILGCDAKEMDAIVCVGLLMTVNWTRVTFEPAVCCEILKTSPSFSFSCNCSQQSPYIG